MRIKSFDVVLEGTKRSLAAEIDKVVNAYLAENESKIEVIDLTVIAEEGRLGKFLVTIEYKEIGGGK